MKVKGLISVILSVEMLSSGLTALAAGELLTEDYSTSESGSKPVNFSNWNAGITSNPKPTVSVETNVLGKGATDVSGVITCPEESKTTSKPAVRKDFSSVDTTQTVNLAFSAAAGDQESSKAVYMTDTKKVITEDSAATVVFATDGGIKIYGEKVADYEVDTWYHFDIEFADGNCTVYLNGIDVYSKAVEGAVAETAYLYYGVYGKTSQEAQSAFYTDDFVVGYGAVAATRKTEIESDIYTIGESLITGIANGTTVTEFLAGINAGTTAISVVDSQGADVEGTSELEVGMKLKITSQDGVNTRYHALDCLNTEILCDVDGETTRRPTEDITVTFNGTGAVKFYVNDVFYETVSSAPYTTTVTNTESGVYTVYGIIITDEGTQKTDSVSYTFEENIVPTVGFTNLDNGVIYEGATVFEVTVNAEDADGEVTDIRFYIDGDEVESDTATFTFGPLALGPHTAYAEVTDNETGVGTYSCNFTVADTEKEELVKLIDYTNYVGTLKTAPANAGTTVSDGDEYGEYYKISGTTAVQYYTDTAQISEAVAEKTPVYIELDMKLSNTQMKSWVLAMRQMIIDEETGNPGPIYADPAGIENGYCGDIAIDPDKWYHYKILYDMPNNVARAWVLNEETQEYELAREIAPLYTEEYVAKWGAFRFNFNQTSVSDITYEACVDNIEYYKLIEQPYFTSVEYLDANGGDVLADNGEVGYELSTIKLNFNNNLSTTLTQDCVTLTQNGVEVDDLAVSVADNALSITINGEVRTLSDYSLSYTGIKDYNENAVADGTIEFTTGPAEYDVVERTVEINGTPVTSLSGITSGSTIDVSAVFVNQADIPQNSKFIVALYSGNKCLGITISDTGVAPNSGRVPVEATTLTVPSSRAIDGTLKLYAYVWSDLLGTRTSQIQSFTME